MTDTALDEFKLPISRIVMGIPDQVVVVLEIKNMLVALAVNCQGGKGPNC